MAPFDDPDDRADAIEAKIARLRRLRGWTGDTAQVKALPEEPPPAAAAASPAAAPDIALHWSDASGPHETLIDRDHFEIGSGDKAHLRILDPQISTRHCRISQQDGGFRVRDLRSTTGTFVNDVQVPLSHPIQIGDILRLGSLTFSIATPGSATSEAAPEAAAFNPAASTPAPEAAAPATPPEAAPSPSTPEPPPRRSAPLPSRPSAADSLSDSPRTIITGTAHAAVTSSRAPGSIWDAVAQVQPAPVAPAATVPPSAGEVPPEATLRWFDAFGAERDILIKPDQPVLVGRRPECGIRLKDDGSVSGRHCIFELEGDALIVRDLGSTNGTFINKERISREVLREGDVVYCGLTGIRVFLGRQRKSAAADDAPAFPRSSAYFVAYRTATGSIATVTLDAATPALALGSDTFTWQDGHLFADGGGEPLPDGSFTAPTGIRFHVVREPPRRERPPIDVANVARWLQALGAEGAELEVLLIDPTTAGGRVELCLWGDGLVEVDLHRDGTKQTSRGQVEAPLVRAILTSLAAAGFPDTLNVDEANTAAPEIHVFAGEDRANVVVGPALAHAIPAYKTARELLLSIALEVTGIA